MDNLRNIVKKGAPNRYFGTQGHKNVQDFLKNKLKTYKNGELNVDSFQLDIKNAHALYDQDFSQKIKPLFKESSSEYKKWKKINDYKKNLITSKKNINGKNFIWKKEGLKDKYIVLVAHYDSVSSDPETFTVNENNKMPGADYNASSVAVLLSLVELLNPLDLKVGVKIVFIDAHTVGFLGSHDYSQKLKSNTLGVINLEMLGYDSKLKDKRKKLNNFKAYIKKSSSKKDLELFGLLSRQQKRASIGIKFEKSFENEGMFDSFRFRDQGYASVTFSQNWEDDLNPNYQTLNDFPETLNQRTFYKAFQYLAVSTIGIGLGIRP